MKNECDNKNKLEIRIRYSLKEEWEYIHMQTWYSMGKDIAWDLLTISSWFPTVIDAEMFDLFFSRNPNITKEQFLNIEGWIVD